MFVLDNRLADRGLSAKPVSDSTLLFSFLVTCICSLLLISQPVGACSIRGSFAPWEPSASPKGYRSSIGDDKAYTLSFTLGHRQERLLGS